MPPVRNWISLEKWRNKIYAQVAGKVRAATAFSQIMQLNALSGSAKQNGLNKILASFYSNELQIINTKLNERPGGKQIIKPFFTNGPVLIIYLFGSRRQNSSPNYKYSN
jgi:hypothetical protein